MAPGRSLIDSLAPDAAMAGRMLGRYEVLQKLASGGMATVYLGRAVGVAGFERLVAIKCCHPHLRDDADFVNMFLAEARLAARLHHPNVVAVLDVDDGEVPFLVMEYIEGESLAGLLKAAPAESALKGAPCEVALRVLADALAGLHAAHELRGANGQSLGLVHRDVSPQNVLVGVDGIARLTDFGIAKAEAHAPPTRDGSLKGKAGYMAPEQLTGAAATRRSDIFAAGVTLWEAITGARLFRADNEVATLQRVMSAKVPAPSDVVPGLPRALDAVVLRALARDPAARYSSAAEFAEALERGPLRPATAREVGRWVAERGASAIASRREVARRPVPSGVRPTDRELRAIRDDDRATPARERVNTDAAATVAMEAPPAFDDASDALSANSDAAPPDAVGTAEIAAPPPRRRDVARKAPEPAVADVSARAPAASASDAPAHSERALESRHNAAPVASEHAPAPRGSRFAAGVLAVSIALLLVAGVFVVSRQRRSMPHTAPDIAAPSSPARTTAPSPAPSPPAPSPPAPAAPAALSSPAPPAAPIVQTAPPPASSPAPAPSAPVPSRPRGARPAVRSGTNPATPPRGGEYSPTSIF